MKLTIFAVMTVFICLLGVVFFLQNQQQTAALSTLSSAKDYQRVELGHDSGKSITVQTVVSAAAQQQGLSGTTSVPDEGMLFVYQSESHPIFWMKDMQYAIDIVWISADGEITGVEVAAAAPVPDTPDATLERYTAPAPTQFVLELQSGKAAELGFVPGTKFISAGFLE